MNQKQKNTGDTLVEIKNLSQAYFHKKVLKQINLTLYKGEILTLTGQNGTGKTTLLKVLSGFLKPLNGVIEYNKNFAGTSLFLPDGFLYEDLTLKENLDIYAKLSNSPKKRYQEISTMLKLNNFLDVKVRNLSRGQKGKGALCRTFLMDVSLYLLDEPFSGLDTASSENLLGMMRHFRDMGKTIFLSTHQAEKLINTSDRWLKLTKGQLVFDKTQMETLS